MHEVGQTNPVSQWAPLLATAQARRQPLLSLLARQAQADGYSPLAVAQALGISPGYLLQLYSDERDVAAMGREVMAAMASYLQQAPVVVRCAAGDIRLTDFFTDDSLEEAAATVRDHLPGQAGQLARTWPVVQAFAGLLAGLNVPPRHLLRNLMADGPDGLAMH